MDRGPQVAGRQLHSQSLLQARSAQLATRTGDAEADAMKPRSTNCGESKCFEEQSLWKNNNDDDNETDRNTERTKRKSRERESKRQDTKGATALTPHSLSFFPPDALLSIIRGLQKHINKKHHKTLETTENRGTKASPTRCR